MPPRRLIALVDQEQGTGGPRLVRSPAVGVFEGLPEAGWFVRGGSVIGTLRIVGRRVGVLLPQGVSGRVDALGLDDSSVPVAFGQPLFEIRRLEASATEDAAGSPGAREGNGGEDVGLGMIEVRSPTHGVFYRRPSADRPPYVEVGSVVERGTVLGLVEVMKCFNPVTLAGPDTALRGEVVRILADDASEVGFGQVLFHIKREAGR
jgi:acetyl-CoA carboxylase biotin carboxyl carrier protein